MAPRYHVVFNSRSGTALSLGLTADRLAESFAKNGLGDVTLDAEDDRDLSERIERTLASDAEVIVAAGGDGTVTALASALVGSDKALALLPLGTANLLARDLKLPLDLDTAIANLASWQPRRIDVGEVNGRAFLHKVIVGVIPQVAAVREKMRGHESIGTMFRFLQHLVRRLSQSRKMAVSITSRDTDSRVQRVQAIAVANNAYDEGFGQVFSRQRLDAGHLTLYILNHLNLGDALRLSAEMLAGRWKGDEALSIEPVRSVTLNAKKPKVPVMLDGEVMMLDLPLEFRIRAQALTVLAPPVAVEDVAVETEAAG